MKLPIDKILNGDALQHLKELPDESIDCVITSPPYWALRDYGSNVECIWDGDENCEHDWVENIQQQRGGRPKKECSVGRWKQAMTMDFGMEGKKIKTNFCSKCGAWKGQLGLEPTFNLFIKHLCDIFDEVKRVLKKSGTCFVNLGDTYCGGHPGGSIHKKGSKYDNSNVIPQIKEGRPAGKLGKEYKEKCLISIPARFQLEMINRGWILRNTIIWHKPNCMPSSVRDRFTVDFEYVFFFVKNKKYYFETQYEPIAKSSMNDNRKDKGLVPHKKGKSVDIKLIKGKTPEKSLLKQDNVPSKNSNIYKGFNERYAIMGTSINSRGRNKRTVWSICPQPFSEAHFAVFPCELAETPIKAGCPEKGIVLDPFFGSGTTGLVALKQNKKFIGIELNPDYIEIAKKRLKPYLEQKKLI